MSITFNPGFENQKLYGFGQSLNFFEFQIVHLLGDEYVLISE
jgi:hypothetical protein